MDTVTDSFITYGWYCPKCRRVYVNIEDDAEHAEHHVRVEIHRVMAG